MMAGVFYLKIGLWAVKDYSGASHRPRVVCTFSTEDEALKYWDNSSSGKRRNERKIRREILRKTDISLRKENNMIESVLLKAGFNSDDSITVLIHLKKLVNSKPVNIKYLTQVIRYSFRKDVVAAEKALNNGTPPSDVWAFLRKAHTKRMNIYQDIKQNPESVCYKKLALIQKENQYLKEFFVTSLSSEEMNRYRAAHQKTGTAVFLLCGQRAKDNIIFNELNRKLLDKRIGQLEIAEREIQRIKKLLISARTKPKKYIKSLDRFQLYDSYGGYIRKIKGLPPKTKTSRKNKEGMNHRFQREKRLEFLDQFQIFLKSADLLFPKPPRGSGWSSHPSQS